MARPFLLLEAFAAGNLQSTELSPKDPQSIHEKRHAMRKKPAKKVGGTPEEPKPTQMSPWANLALKTEALLSDLKSLEELFLVVAPIVAERDKQTSAELRDVVTQLEKFTQHISKSRVRKKPSFGSDLLARAKKIKVLALKLHRADSMFRSNMLGALVTRFEDYEADLIKIVLTAFPARLDSPDKTLTYADVLKLGNLEEIKSALISVEIDKIMRQSPRDQFKHLEGLVNFKFRENQANWPAFVEITERRNIHTHCGGKVSNQYLEICRAEKVPLNDKTILGTPLPVTDDYFRSSLNLLFEFAVQIADASLRRLFPDHLAEADDSLLETGYKCEVAAEWPLALSVFQYATSLPPKLVSSENMKKLFIINKAICLKATGASKACSALLDGVDWSAAAPKFLLATQVLKEQYPAAEKSLSFLKGDAHVTEHACREWPLFNEFRKTPEFKRAFKRLFGKNYDDLPPSTAELKSRPSPTDA